MDMTQIPAVITAVLAVLVAFGGGIKWMVGRMDKADEADRQTQKDEREKLEKQFQVQIESLRREIDKQEAELSHMRTEITSYVRHVGVLEGLLKANGIEVPAFPKTAA